MQRPSIVPIAELVEEPYSSVICYPKLNNEELTRRVAELEGLGVTAVEFSGGASAFGVRVPLLGKGFAGVVVVGYIKGQRVALKILRVDAERPDLLHEARMLCKANTVNVGPQLVGASRNFLLTQLIEGDHLPNWLRRQKEKRVVQKVLGEILEQCWLLDEMGLDHGELSNAPKHIIVDNNQKPWLIDFESASDSRKPSNVTAVCNFLFSGTGKVAQLISEILGKRNKNEIMLDLKVYRQQGCRENFEKIVDSCLR
ncbi:MAG: serine/threonine protein kinase [Candidatus Bathyarchaeota archaeon]|nr:serine/threonine protein kinase [Candidatus Bathyarchaeota archaeon]